MSRADVSLLDILIDGFEKNEVEAGYHRRDLPMHDEDAAAKRFAAWAREATSWKGTPAASDHAGPRRFVRWPDLEILQAGRGVRVLARAPSFDSWWHESATWAGDPLGLVRAWMAERNA